MGLLFLHKFHERRIVKVPFAGVAVKLLLPVEDEILQVQHGDAVPVELEGLI